MESFNTTCPSVGSVGTAQLLLAHLFTTISKAYCDLSASYPEDRSAQVFADPNDVYDFIVVGGGSAGSVVASRLSEILGWRVLLVEAGGNPPIESDIPALVSSLIDSQHDWHFWVERTEKACRSMADGRCVWPKGKMLGGSSSMNGMFYIRGLPEDYDHWERLGNAGWSYRDVLKYFKKLEKVNLRNSSAKIHGYQGYQNVEKFAPITARKFSNMDELVRNAVTELGLPFHEDFAASPKSGSVSLWATVKNGVRQSAARSYLVPAKDRPNLVVVKGTSVTRLLIDNATRSVYGVEMVKNGVSKNVTCSKEVILSAGAINSPKIMMLSGIGPKDHLNDLGIRNVADLKVGRNLQDHVMVPLLVKLNVDRARPDQANVFYSYLTEHKELGNFPCSMIFHDSLNTTADYPDLQYHVLDEPLCSKPSLMETFNLNENTMKWLAGIGHLTDVIFVGPTLLRPKSIGGVFLRNARSEDPPRLVSGYLDDEDDVRTLVRGVKFVVERLLRTRTFENASLLALPAEECAKFGPRTDQYYECYVRNFATTVYHVSGSCKMGSADDPNAVVDDSLRVFGMTGLRVVDSSIMPRIVSGNTNVPTIMIGEKGSDLIKKDWLK